MDELIEIFIKNGLNPFQFDPVLLEIEKNRSRSDIVAILIIHIRKELTMSDLARELGTPLSTLTSIVKRLSDQKIVIRKRNNNDRRIIYVELSPEGEIIAKEIREKLELLLYRITNSLTPEELQQLIKLVMKATRAIQSEDKVPTVQSSVRKIRIDE